MNRWPGFYNTTKWDGCPFFAYFGFLFVFIDPKNATLIGFVAAIICFIVIYLCKLEEKKLPKKMRIKVETQNGKAKIRTFYPTNKYVITTTETTDILDFIEKETKLNKFEIKKIWEFEDKDKTSQNMHYRIFAAVFGLIAAFAMTNSLETFNNEELKCFGINDSKITCNTYPETFNDLPNFFASPQVILVASFFSIGILMYHCGIMFLSTDAVKLVYSGKPVITFFSSLIIFLEGIVLFIAALKVTSIMSFTFWMFLLMILDIGWVLLNIVKKLDPLFQWLHLDSVMAIFLIIIIQSSISTTDSFEIADNSLAFAGVAFEYWAILGIFVLRTILDYNMGWEYWSKFVPESS